MSIFFTTNMHCTYNKSLNYQVLLLEEDYCTLKIYTIYFLTKVHFNHFYGKDLYFRYVN